MNYQNIIILAVLHLSSCTSYHTSFKNSMEDNFTSSISIFNIEAHLIDKTYIITGHTQTIPPSYIKKIRDYIYEITLSIKVNGVNRVWDSTFEVVLILPNGEIMYYLLNEDEFALSSSFVEDFKLIVETPKRGRTKCALSLINRQRDEFRLTDYDWWFIDLN